MLVARDVESEQRERPVERHVMPFGGVDEHAIKIEAHSKSASLRGSRRDRIFVADYAWHLHDDGCRVFQRKKICSFARLEQDDVACGKRAPVHGHAAGGDQRDFGRDPMHVRGF